MPVSTAKYYYLQSAGAWGDEFELSDSTVWTDLAIGSVVIPDSLHLEQGQEPDKLIFNVMADSAYNNSGIYPPIASATYDAAHRPDGTIGTMSFPVYEEDPLREFTIVRLMEGDGPTPVAEDTPIWIGIITGASLDLATETWTVEAIDLVRWRLDCYIVKGVLWNEYGVPFRYYPKLFTVFNSDGLEDCSISSITGLPYLLFDNAGQLNSSGLKIVKHWRLGDVLNYLRKCWYSLYLATDKTVIGVNGISRFAEWPEVNAVEYPWLFTGLAASPNVTADLVLGGLTVNEAIDTVITMAGGGWAARHRANDRYEMVFWPKAGSANCMLTRGKMGETPEDEEPDIVGGTVALDWSKVRSHTIVPGIIHAHEATIAYDPINLSGDLHPRIITKGWSDADEALYLIAESGAGFDPITLNSKYPDVYQKFIIDPDFNWDTAFYTDPPTTPSRKGKREFLNMITKYKNTEITAKVWRWESGSFRPQPSTVSLQFNKDGSFQIMGFDPKDTPLITSIADGDPRFPRYCEPASIADAFRPFAITLCVAGDERAWGENEDIPPSGYPNSLEDCATPIKMQNSSVKDVRHFLISEGGQMVATENGDTYGIADKGLAAQSYVTDNRAELNAMATRRRDESLYPKATGFIKMRKFNWNFIPGLRLQYLEGGGVPFLPTIQIGGMIRKVSFMGLGLAGSETEQVLQLGDE
jgi:hypothetical protein